MNILKYIAIFVVTLGLGSVAGIYGINAFYAVSNSFKIETGNYAQYGVSKEAPVKLYTTEWCPYCKKATQFLDNHNINYIKVDIEKDPVALKEFESLNGDSLPVVIISDGLIRGFNQAAIERQLEKTELL